MNRTKHSGPGIGQLDSRYVNVTGDTMTGNLILNDNISLLLGTGSDGELFHDGTNTYFQNNTGGIIIENDASDGDITFKVNDGGVDTTVMTIDGETGRVGIGTTGPSSPLHLSSTTGQGSPLLIIQSTHATDPRATISLRTGTTEYGFMQVTSSGFTIERSEERRVGK